MPQKKKSVAAAKEYQPHLTSKPFNFPEPRSRILSMKQLRKIRKKAARTTTIEVSEEKWERFEETAEQLGFKPDVLVNMVLDAFVEMVQENYRSLTMPLMLEEVAACER